MYKQMVLLAGVDFSGPPESAAQAAFKGLYVLRLPMPGCKRCGFEPDAVAAGDLAPDGLCVPCFVATFDQGAG